MNLDLVLVAQAYLGVLFSYCFITQPTYMGVLEALDLWLVLGELLLVAVLCVTFRATRVFFRVSQAGYDTLLTLCQARGVSFAEVTTVSTVVGGFLVFDFFVTLADDDLLEAISYSFALIISLAVCLLFLAVDVHYYYTISAVSSGAVTLRVLYTDLINNGLCLLRVFFC